MAIYYNLDSILMVIIIGDGLQLPPIVLIHLRKLDETDIHNLHIIFSHRKCLCR